MNNEGELAVPAHNLHLRKATKGKDHQLYKNMTSNI
jgi:hypothetical protein